MEAMHTQAKRLYESVSREAGAEKAKELLEKLPLGKTPSEKKKAQWACDSCAALDAAFGDETARRIRRACHCKPSPRVIPPMRKKWLESESLEAFAASASSGEGFQIESDGSALVLIYPVCYCSFIKHSQAPVPKTWCECSLGYAEEMFESVTGEKVTAELLESVALGGSACRIRVRAVGGSFHK